MNRTTQNNATHTTDRRASSSTSSTSTSAAQHTGSFCTLVPFFVKHLLWTSFSFALALPSLAAHIAFPVPTPHRPPTSPSPSPWPWPWLGIRFVHTYLLLSSVRCGIGPPTPFRPFVPFRLLDCPLGLLPFSKAGRQVSDSATNHPGVPDLRKVPDYLLSCLDYRLVCRPGRDGPLERCLGLGLGLGLVLGLTLISAWVPQLLKLLTATVGWLALPPQAPQPVSSSTSAVRQRPQVSPHLVLLATLLSNPRGPQPGGQGKQAKHQQEGRSRSSASCSRGLSACHLFDIPPPHPLVILSWPSTARHRHQHHSHTHPRTCHCHCHHHPWIVAWWTHFLTSTCEVPWPIPPQIGPLPLCPLFLVCFSL